MALSSCESSASSYARLTAARCPSGHAKPGGVAANANGAGSRQAASSSARAAPAVSIVMRFIVLHSPRRTRQLMAEQGSNGSGCSAREAARRPSYPHARSLRQARNRRQPARPDIAALQQSRPRNMPSGQSPQDAAFRCNAASNSGFPARCPLIDNAVNLGFYAPARWLQRIRRTGTPDIPRSSGEGSSMKQVRSIPRRGLLSSALLLALAPAVSAQVAAPDPQDQQEQQSGQTATAGEVEPETLDTIVVTGIRGSLISSMNLKRDSQGIVDGIVAQDIGKSPDTNQAESVKGSKANGREKG